ncbi:ABC transporter ATP-binding protein [Microcoleus sp. FACHB-831]|uniref:ABC transporter ATP-binding protein n=1 Tax=Microcoleus sp. FACHB-831 TaxID=2692827 RepID=UPI001687C463|nr:ABC transporter ATP-binding protein [Microcoleus sp. FACHB-831]MBD1923384.1 ABC transporter ATP-binding protein [Microcoleus sp. FACHB-831]
MQIVLRSISYFRKDLRLIVTLLFLIGASVLLNLLNAWPMAILVDTVLSPTPKPTWIHRLFLAPFGESRVSQVIGMALVGMLVKILSDTVIMLRTMLNFRIKYNGTLRVRTELYDKLQALSLGWHGSRSQGDAIYRLSYDSLGPWGVIDTLIGSTAASVTLTAMIWIMLSRHVLLTVFALSITPLLILANWYFGERIRRRAFESKRIDALMTSTMQQAIELIGLIQSFGREATESRRFTRMVEQSVSASMRLNWQETLFPLAVQVIFALGGAVIFGYGGYLVYRDQFLRPVPDGVTAGDLIVFMAYLGQLWDPLGWVLGFTTKIQTFVASCDRVFVVIDEPPAISDEPDARSLLVHPRTLTLAKVSFEYLPGRPVLREIDATIEPGQMVAFLGPSGTGKSTLLNLLPRFYDPTEGSVQLDGFDLRTLKVADVRKHMALVTQGSPLFPGTIAENIAYGSADATFYEIKEAAIESGAAEFIETLPSQYDTMLSEGGQNLSGGQRQRLAIARALATKAPILILDEPTSSLDLKHEQWVIETLQRLRRKRTIILVTHRLETAVDCDRIFVMHEGKIVEEGTHDELLSQRGSYSRMLGYHS